MGRLARSKAKSCLCKTSSLVKKPLARCFKATYRTQRRFCTLRFSLRLKTMNGKPGAGLHLAEDSFKSLSEVCRAEPAETLTGTTGSTVSWKRRTSLSSVQPVHLLFGSCKKSVATDAAVLSRSRRAVREDAVTSCFRSSAHLLFSAVTRLVSLSLLDYITVSDARWDRGQSLVQTRTEARNLDRPTMFGGASFDSPMPSYCSPPSHLWKKYF